MDLVQYGQLYNEAMSGMDIFFEDMKESMKNFNKKSYPAMFEQMTKKYGKTLLCVEEIYQCEDDKEQWLNKLAERFVNQAEALIQSKRWKFQRENVLIDCNMFVVGYVLPVILESKSESAKPFAQTIADSWNARFGTQMECGDYDRIYGGFKTSILGINIGK